MSKLSMTGFGKSEAKNQDHQVEIELKSVNHRFKEVRFRSPSSLNEIELDLKKKLFEHFKRGSFEVFIRVRKESHLGHFENIDDLKINDFLKKLTVILDKGGFKYNLNPTDFLRPEFFKDKDESINEALFNLVHEAYDKAIEQLHDSRLAEGEKLVEVINKHKQQYLEFFKIIEQKADEIKESLETKLKKKLQEYHGEVTVDDNRFMQEIIYYMEKYDIHEEINRIKIHLSKLDKILQEKGEIGRQVDFLLQELNRETNTVGSKSSSEEVSSAVVQMKVQLEKIREQGLNLE
ncbi:MAG: YicC/YloC family endoribonuclease [Bacteriovoracaceae bacterium]